MAGDINSKTVGGLIAYCDWLADKGYQSANAVSAWKVAVRKVFEALAAETWENTSTEGLDLDDAVGRFRTLTASTYKSETIDVYAKRVRNALDAHAHFLETGRAPSFKKAAPRTKRAAEEKGTATAAPATNIATGQAPVAEAGWFDFVYPLTTGGMIRMNIPKQMSVTDVDRLCAVLRTFQADEQRQIPMKVAA